MTRMYRQAPTCSLGLWERERAADAAATRVSRLYVSVNCDSRSPPLPAAPDAHPGCGCLRFAQRPGDIAAHASEKFSGDNHIS